MVICRSSSARKGAWTGNTQYKITVGAALRCVPAILHWVVKCNNILLDSKYEAYLADFRLAKLMNCPKSQLYHAMSRISGSYGYTLLQSMATPRTSPRRATCTATA